MSSPPSRSSKMRESVVFPAPDGEESTSIRPRRRTSRYPLSLSLVTLRPTLFDVLDLLAQLLDRDLEIEPDPRQLDIAGFGTEGIGLAIELLAEEVELAADGATGRDQGTAGFHMSAEPIELLAHIGARSHERDLLDDAIGRRGRQL